jgi:hypothetical protein
MAMMLEIARHYAAIPQAQRRRTITFLTTSDEAATRAFLKIIDGVNKMEIAKIKGGEK